MNNEIKVNIGSTYEVVENVGSRLKKGEIWYAWYYGELILLECKQDRMTFTNRELPYEPGILIRAIKAGKVRELPKSCADEA